MSTQLPEETLKQWRDEFELLPAHQSSDSISFNLLPEKYRQSGEYKDFCTQNMWLGYLAARTKAQDENEDTFKTFTLDLADRYEKEITQLKQQLKEKDEAFEKLQKKEIDKHDALFLMGVNNVQVREELRREREALNEADLVINEMRVYLDFNKETHIMSRSTFHQNMREQNLKIAEIKKRYLVRRAF